MVDFLLNPIFDDNMLKQVAWMGDWGIVLLGLLKSIIIIAFDALAVTVLLLILSLFYGCYRAIYRMLFRRVIKGQPSKTDKDKMGHEIKAA